MDYLQVIFYIYSSDTLLLHSLYRENKTTYEMRFATRPLSISFNRRYSPSPVSFFQCESFISMVKISGGIPEWREGSRCFIFLSMVNLNLMPLKKIIYYRVNNVQILKVKQTLGLNLSQSWPKPSECLNCWCVWVRTGLGVDALCMYIGSFVGRADEKSLSWRWSHSNIQLTALTFCQFMYLMGIFAELQ